MSSGKPEGAIELGRHYYLFKSKTNGKDCVISAHGGHRRENRAFTVPKGLKIHFYVPHQFVLNDPGIGDFLNKLGEAQPVETCTAGYSCMDYYLTKYQGKHNKQGETYERIAREVKQVDESRQSLFGLLMSPAGQTNVKLAESVKGRLTGLWNGSVLTIRHRMTHAAGYGMLLSDAVANIQKALPSISDIHCEFCRADSFTAMGEDPEAKVTYGPARLTS